MRLLCNVTGHPKPKIEWFHNGNLINYDWIVSYEEPKLLIQTYEERYTGIYQCVATNVAGEAQVTGLLSWHPKTYPEAPKNPKCLPVNAASFKVQFEKPHNFKVRTKKHFSTQFVKLMRLFVSLYNSGQRLHIILQVNIRHVGQRK